MEAIHRQFLLCLALGVISFIQATGVFYKVENMQQIESDALMIQEDVVNCAKESSCRNLTRQSSGNWHSEINQPNLYFEKISPGADAIYLSCVEALYWNSNSNGTYRIRHQNMIKFTYAECRMIGGTITAHIHHDSEDQVEVNGYEAPRSYSKPITYKSDLDSVKRFVDSSLSCRQFVRIDCKHMKLFDGSTQDGALIDRDNNIMKYFGGGPRNGRGCKCAVDNTCYTSGKLCNCDSNDNVWRHDEGYVIDKIRLPLTEVRLGDTGSSMEQGKLTIGALECTEL